MIDEIYFYLDNIPDDIIRSRRELIHLCVANELTLFTDLEITPFTSSFGFLVLPVSDEISPRFLKRKLASANTHEQIEELGCEKFPDGPFVLHKADTAAILNYLLNGENFSRHIEQIRPAGQKNWYVIVEQKITPAGVSNEWGTSVHVGSLKCCLNRNQLEKFNKVPKIDAVDYALMHWREKMHVEGERPSVESAWRYLLQQPGFKDSDSEKGIRFFDQNMQKKYLSKTALKTRLNRVK